MLLKIIAACRGACWALWVTGVARGSLSHRISSELSSAEQIPEEPRPGVQSSRTRNIQSPAHSVINPEPKAPQQPPCLFVFAHGRCWLADRGWESGQLRCQGARARIPRSHPELEWELGLALLAVNGSTEGLDRRLQLGALGLLLPVQGGLGAVCPPEPSPAALPTSRALQPRAGSSFSPQFLPQSSPSCFLLQRKRN